MSNEIKIPKIDGAAGRMLGWAVAAVLGVVFTLSIDAGRGEVDTANMKLRVEKLEVALDAVKLDLATGGPAMLRGRVDAFALETKEYRAEVNGKLDKIQELLVRLKSQ